MTIKFVDKRSFEPLYNYIISNEHMDTLREMVAKVKPKKVACITSGGEVPLTVMLPVVESVVAIDHSYLSTMWALLKALALIHVGALKFKAAIDAQDINLIWAYMQDVAPHLPDVIKPYFVRAAQWNRSSLSGLPDHWIPLGLRQLEMIREKLGEVTFIHGDITDVGEDFDLFYLSNALEHTAFDRNRPNPLCLTTSVRKHGHILHTIGGMGIKCNVNKPWNKVAEITRRDSIDPTFGPMNWTYRLEERTE